MRSWFTFMHVGVVDAGGACDATTGAANPSDVQTCYADCRCYWGDCIEQPELGELCDVALEYADFPCARSCAEWVAE